MTTVTLLHPTLDGDFPLFAAKIPCSDRTMQPVTLLHDFQNELTEVEHYAKRLLQFQEIDGLDSFPAVHHLCHHHAGWTHCVYYPSTGKMRVSQHALCSAMPEVWTVEANTITREVADSAHNGRQVRRKVWHRYRDNSYRDVWEVTYNEHPRSPLHLRNAKIPVSISEFRRELLSQMRANDRMPFEVVKTAVRAIENWVSIVGDFTPEQMSQVWDQLARLQHLHHFQHPQMLPELFASLDFLTMGSCRKLTEVYAELQSNPPAP